MASARFLDPSSIPLKRQSGGNIWATLVSVTQGITVVVILSGLLLFFVPVIHQTHQYQSDITNLQGSIETAKDQQREIRIETEHMKSDPAFVEHIARDRLNMGRPGEEIMHFAPYQATPPASRLGRARSQDNQDQ
jgi:cell division protein DivIC